MFLECTRLVCHYCGILNAGSFEIILLDCGIQAIGLG